MAVHPVTSPLPSFFPFPYRSSCTPGGDGRFLPPPLHIPALLPSPSFRSFCATLPFPNHPYAKRPLALLQPVCPTPQKQPPAVGWRSRADCGLTKQPKAEEISCLPNQTPKKRYTCNPTSGDCPASSDPSPSPSNPRGSYTRATRRWMRGAWPCATSKSRDTASNFPLSIPKNECSRLSFYLNRLRHSWPKEGHVIR